MRDPSRKLARGAVAVFGAAFACSPVKRLADIPDPTLNPSVSLVSLGAVAIVASEHDPKAPASSLPPTQRRR